MQTVTGVFTAHASPITLPPAGPAVTGPGGVIPANLRASQVRESSLASPLPTPTLVGADVALSPTPRKVPLPLGGVALMYTRENLVYLLKCSHGELGRLLKARLAPLPIRIDGQILWYVDEVLGAQSTVERTLNRWRRR